MEIKQFNKLFQVYKSADIEEKIGMYCATQGLTEEQYMQLLRAFPVNHITRLEKAVS